MSIFDTVCKRSLNFVRQCLNSLENVLVNFVSRNAVFFSRTWLWVERCCRFYCERFGANLPDAVTLAKERKVEDDKEIVCRTCMIKELFMVRAGGCCLSSDEFVKDDVCALLSYLSVEGFYSRCNLFYILYFVLLFICVLSFLARIYLEHGVLVL